LTSQAPVAYHGSMTTYDGPSPHTVHANIAIKQANVYRVAKQCNQALVKYGPGSTQYQRAVERLNVAKRQLAETKATYK
jgi:hypothetical protein